MEKLQLSDAILMERAALFSAAVPISGYEGFRAAMDGYYGEGACFELRIRGCGAYRIPEEE